jgi:hypothetical protein
MRFSLGWRRRKDPPCFIFCAEPQGCESMGSMGVDIMYYCNTTCARTLQTTSGSKRLRLHRISNIYPSSITTMKQHTVPSRTFPQRRAQALPIPSLVSKHSYSSICAKWISDPFSNPHPCAVPHTPTKYTLPRLTFHPNPTFKNTTPPHRYIAVLHRATSTP